jgi:hypothetical protein
MLGGPRLESWERADRMAGTGERDSESVRRGWGSAASTQREQRRGLLRYIPGLAYILALYLIGTYFFPDARATLIEWRGYRVSWIELLLVAAAMVALAEQMRVSHPGIDNTVEALAMAAMAGAMVLLFALAAAGVSGLGIFGTTEFLLLTLIAVAQVVVAILINARTLRRSIGLGDDH